MERRKKSALTNRINSTPKHPWENRKALSEEYDNPVSGREQWWRVDIRETPLPGTYEPGSFLDDLKARPNTYRFKSDGRTRDPDPHRKGAGLLPGAYEHQSFLDSLEQRPATYNFKGPARGSTDINFGLKDKDISISPQAYGIEKYLSLTTDKTPSKHFMFRSQSRRFPSKPFMPKHGPGPGNYEYKEPGSQHCVSSSFMSKTPRFCSSHTRTPGPGSYESTLQYPLPRSVEKMGRQHGLFFSSAF